MLTRDLFCNCMIHEILIFYSDDSQECRLDVPCCAGSGSHVFFPYLSGVLLDLMRAVLVLFFFFFLFFVLLPLASSSSSSQTSSPSSSHVARCQHGPPDCSRQPRISLRSCRLQWAAPDLNSGLQIAEGSADLNRGNAGPQPQKLWAVWATPDLIRGPPERNGQRRTSAARRYVRRCVRCQKRMSEDMSEEMSEDMSKDMTEICQKRMS